MNGKLLLEDGTTFDGVWLNEPCEKIGDVVLNTAVVGYQEILTDPSNVSR